jgi:hypothetical protein
LSNVPCRAVKHANSQIQKKNVEKNRKEKGKRVDFEMSRERKFPILCKSPPHLSDNGILIQENRLTLVVM